MNQFEDVLQHGVQQTYLSFDKNNDEDKNKALIHNSYELMEISTDWKNNQRVQIK